LGKRGDKQDRDKKPGGGGGPPPAGKTATRDFAILELKTSSLGKQKRTSAT